MFYNNALDVSRKNGVSEKRNHYAMIASDLLT